MRILVTGGAGFIGSHFVRCLLGGGYPGLEDARVTVLDKLTYAGGRHNLDPFLDDPRLRFLRGDVCDGEAVREALRDCSVVVHFAAESHVDRSVADAEAFVRTNVLGTQVLLQAATEAELDSFVMVSTDEVYGSIESGSWDEDFPLRPNSPYSASKASAELLARSFHHTHGLPVRIARPSNTYGPRQFPEKVIPLFVTRLLDGRKIPLYGDGSHVREWIHVDDHCRALALIAVNGRPGEAYNIGGGKEISNLELTGMLLELSSADWSSVLRVADRKGHDFRYSVDPGKICGELGFTPSVDIVEGMADTVRWYAENRHWWEPLVRN
ncbi:dTDP-glucose 4,6-dehydratase [Streptomyces sp. CB00316]|uniref:dTDP-glucose 4,6-dehydratase n=1 Tax=Streptomyces sp. CB00316 TaxID=1703932 RepID=UPI000938C107|nr:dTDP-glucose 4,6-dehydratase [Streptomyces sp. CB00316]OKJ20137.1 dTDP-glucose 4,6-dehydratase [Streptomyces sp. CB00316]